ncbi:MAG: hypothetical protein ACOC1S_04910, partial [bacterium]
PDGKLLILINYGEAKTALIKNELSGDIYSLTGGKLKQNNNISKVKLKRDEVKILKLVFE